MAEEKGTISVNTENIFPIIKKFLYSDTDIFLRELIANAEDATNKIKKLASMGEFNGELGELNIEVILDKENKQIKVIDRGIGMTAEEIKKYINQIAFSGAVEFVEKYKDQDTSGIIGKFGLGFYSAFMIADKVEIRTKSYKDDTEAAHWICEGQTDFVITATDKTDRGTEIILNVNEESEEFLDENKLRGILERYCRFMPIPIVFGEEEEVIKAEKEDEEDTTIKKPRVINTVDPIWSKSPNELKDEDYLSFYKELYPMSEDPMFWIHLNVDYPFNLTGVLYFPKVKEDVTQHRDKIQLYSRQVFITDEVKDIVPEFLTLMHGVIDSPDIPLNVSRSYLQSDSNVKKINSYITKKVADKLGELFKSDRASYEQKWDSIGLFVKYGIITDEKFYDKAQKFALLQNLEGKYFTLEEYKTKVEANQKDKDENTVFLYTNDPAKQDVYIQSVKKKEYDVLKMDQLLDNHYAENLERKLEKVSFKRVDSDPVNKLIDKDEKLEAVLSTEDQEKVKEVFKKATANDTLDVAVEALAPEDTPVVVTLPEFMRRMQEMAEMQGYGGMMGGMPNPQKVIVNGNSPLIDKLVKTESEEDQKRIAKHLYDLGMLSHGALTGGELTSFINRSVELMS